MQNDESLENAILFLREETHRKFDHLIGLAYFFTGGLMLMNLVIFSAVMLRPTTVCPASQSEVAK